MKWIKFRDKKPDNVEFELCYRDIDGHFHSMYVAWDTKLKFDNHFYEWLDETPDDKDKEIERLKGLIEQQFYLRRVGTGVSAVTADAAWQQFKTDNNL